MLCSPEATRVRASLSKASNACTKATRSRAAPRHAVIATASNPFPTIYNRSLPDNLLLSGVLAALWRRGRGGGEE